VLLHRRDEWLHEKDIALAAVGVELYIQAIVAETSNRRRAEVNAKILAHLLRQRAMGVAAEYGDLPHGAILIVGLWEDIVRSLCIIASHDLFTASCWSAVRLLEAAARAGRSVLHLDETTIAAAGGDAG
jgi:hypothetical protein